MNIALILSGGTGTRLGADIPKQYIKVGGKMIISYCIDTFERCPMIDCIQIVAEPVWQDTLSSLNISRFRGCSSPGGTRQLSILNGLSDVLRYASDDDKIIIHDGARPLVSHAMIENVILAADGHDGALPVLPMKDTVYLSEDGRHITSLLDRSMVVAGQAPECFVLGKYYKANTRLLPDDILSVNGSTEPAVKAGMDIAVVRGDENNFKITTKHDLERFEEIIRNRRNA